ncbi:hypothetical protein KGQ19_09980 [Catenulispora sp. NL8]|uniref:SAM-dependent methyltransferase n=1 Tax=Catenulispora pinistramenti TaxID=2705254 RepID=A0ABS5KMC2_9ACTN|nr:hypothetical protein [Catenulispora pinistramenti]MBS2547201.1 hypothetical protein [Catenulispora pinistramenti]
MTEEVMTTAAEELSDADELSDAELAALAAELCAAVLARPRPFGPPWAHPPLAAGPADQIDSIGNPYWRVVRNLPTQIWDDSAGPTTMWLHADAGIRDRVRAAGLDRDGLSRRYSWSIPSPGDIAWIAATAGERGVVEIGAGGGYWAWLMRAAGIDTLAYDPFAASELNGYAKRAYTAVEPGDDSVAALHGDRALFLCWPNNDDAWAARALTAYRGDLLIYAGQEAGGCTADDRFFEVLESGWEQAGASADHVTYVGVPCRLTAWRR